MLPRPAPEQTAAPSKPEKAAKPDKRQTRPASVREDKVESIFGMGLFDGNFDLEVFDGVADDLAKSAIGNSNAEIEASFSTDLQWDARVGCYTRGAQLLNFIDATHDTVTQMGFDGPADERPTAHPEFYYDPEDFRKTMEDIDLQQKVLLDEFPIEKKYSDWDTDLPFRLKEVLIDVEAMASTAGSTQIDDIISKVTAYQVAALNDKHLRVPIYNTVESIEDYIAECKDRHAILEQANMWMLEESPKQNGPEAWFDPRIMEQMLRIIRTMKLLYHQIREIKAGKSKPGPNIIHWKNDDLVLSGERGPENEFDDLNAHYWSDGAYYFYFRMHPKAINIRANNDGWLEVGRGALDANGNRNPYGNSFIPPPYDQYKQPPFVPTPKGIKAPKKHVANKEKQQECPYPFQLSPNKELMIDGHVLNQPDPNMQLQYHGPMTNQINPNMVMQFDGPMPYQTGPYMQYPQGGPNPYQYGPTMPYAQGPYHYQPHPNGMMPMGPGYQGFYLGPDGVQKFGPPQQQHPQMVRRAPDARPPTPSICKEGPSATPPAPNSMNNRAFQEEYQKEVRKAEAAKKVKAAKEAKGGKKTDPGWQEVGAGVADGGNGWASPDQNQGDCGYNQEEVWAANDRARGLNNNQAGGRNNNPAGAWENQQSPIARGGFKKNAASYTSSKKSSAANTQGWGNNDNQGNDWENNGQGGNNNNQSWGKNNDDHGRGNDNKKSSTNDGGWGNQGNDWEQKSKTPSAQGWNNTPQSVKSGSHGWFARSQQGSRGDYARPDSDPKFAAKPYWNDWNKSPSETVAQNAKPPQERRNPYQYPAPPRPTIPSDQAKGVSHGVHVGKGANYAHKSRRPVYIDSMEKPYAIFTFKYRTKEVLEKILKKRINDDDIKKINEQAELKAIEKTPHDELARKYQKLLHSKKSQAHHAEETASASHQFQGWGETKSASKQSHGWGNAADGPAEDVYAPPMDGWGDPPASKVASQKGDAIGWAADDAAAAPSEVKDKKMEKKSKTEKNDQDGKGWAEDKGSYEHFPDQGANDRVWF